MTNVVFLCRFRVGTALHLHYGDANPELHHTLLPQAIRDMVKYSDAVVNVVMDGIERSGAKTNSLLDIGCGMGGPAFLLARHFDAITALDIEKPVIDTCKALQEKRCIPYALPIEGELVDDFMACVPEDVDRSRVEFRQTDALCLAPSLGVFDAVLVSNTLDKLAAPNGLIGRLGGSRGLVRQGGILVTIDGFNWQGKVTPKQLWLGGYTNSDGHPVRSSTGLEQVLGDHFELISTTNIPCLNYQNERKYTLEICEARVWRAL